MKELPGQFEFKALYKVIIFNKELEPIENYITYATKITEFYNTNTTKEINIIHLQKVITIFPDVLYKRFISLLEHNIDPDAAFILSTPSRKFTDDLIDKFKQLKEELNMQNKYDDRILVRHFRNDKALAYIRQYISKNMSSFGLYLINNLNKEIIDYIIKNNIICDLNYETWEKIKELYYEHIDIFKEIFTKFTVKQTYNLRIKKFLEDGGYDELLNNYIKENVETINLYCYSLKGLNDLHIEITPSQYFKIYTELNDIQMRTFYGFIKLNFTFEQALSNTYQVIE